MEVEELIVRPSPWDRINCISKLFFSWVFPIFIKGHVKDLEIKDLYKCSKHDEADKLCDKLERQWNKELKKENPSFVKALSRAFIFEFTIGNIVAIINECGVRIAQPIFLGHVIKYFQKDSNITYNEAVYYAIGIVGCSMFSVIVGHPVMLQYFKIGMRMRVACCTLMYKKSLRLSRGSIGKTTVGQIVNLMSNDVNRIDDFAHLFCAWFFAPLQSTIIIYLLWQYLGSACLSGLGILILFIPLQGVMGKLFQKVRSKTAQLTDNRIRIMNEIITGMRVIKMYAWEMPFADLVADARKLEVNQIRNACFLKAINLGVYFVATGLILFSCFMTFIAIGGKLTPENVFVTMAFFNGIKFSVTRLFPASIAGAAETLVACKRIQKYMLLEEVTQSSHKKNPKNIITQTEFKEKESSLNGILNSQNMSEGFVNINDISSRWCNDIEEPTLQNITAHVKAGQLLAIIGSVGSGKSSLLMSILNEMTLDSGNIEINGTLAYASQEPWSFNSSVRNNILFGAEYDENKFNKIIDVCALKRDFTLFPYGDMTLVGERGVSLSGGQKARITLARALYRDADIYLLDDPLSAVDASVAKHIFQKCIIEHLKTKARILVTHQLQFLQNATRILVLRDGKSIAYGTYDELINSGVDLMSIIKTNDTKTNDNETKENNKDIQRIRVSSVSSSVSCGDSNESCDSSENLKHDSEPKIADEMKMKGSINSKIYWAYIRAGAGPILIVLTLFSTIFSQILMHGTEFWLTIWTNEETKQNNDNGKKLQNFSNITNSTETPEIKPINESLNAIIYTVLISLLFVSGLLRTFTFFIMCMKSSINLHNKIFKRLLRAPIALFDNNPIGRILNRFTKDTGIVDEILPDTAYELNITLTYAIGVLIIVSIVSWYMIVPAFLLTLFVIVCRYFYIRASRDIKRFEGLMRSPVFSHVSTTLSGLSTVRAFTAEDEFIKQYCRYQNDHTATIFLFLCTSRGFGILMDWICIAFISLSVTFLMIFPENIPGGNAGLALSSALVLTGMTQWGVRCSVDVESYMTAVERMLEYTRLTPEADLESSPDKKPAPEWPMNGEIIFMNMNLRYENSSNAVLRDITCHIRGGEKIGIVGRTGAGKSSIIAALFRMTEPEGSIVIDGIDTKSIGLHDLRKKISIIPQDPVVFTGPVRRNIDPFNEHTDDQLWSVLAEVQLKDAVSQLPGQLDSELTEGGSNFSVGQRQLICLARAMLRDNKILVLDEATANVDHKTDALIQSTIRNKFNNCTVLTIAHRINTIIDSDRVMVLDSGEIVEFDAPYLLLKNSDGHFSKLIKETGKSMAQHLQNLATDSNNRTYN